MTIPHFIIKNNFQKGGVYQDLLTSSILSDVCLKVTGRQDYTCDFDNDGYNKGRLAVLNYQDRIIYISFSEVKIEGRNSSFQSFSTALTKYILEGNPKKEICFYFLPEIRGNFETDYFIFNYRLMKTAKVNFLNDDIYLNESIIPFTSPEDIVVHKDKIRTKNSGNRSTYITRNSENNLQIFGKTYGASKYETTNLCLALSEIVDSEIELYEIGEGGLTNLPLKSKEAIESLGVVKIFTSNRSIEKIGFEESDSLRSKEYIYNLLEKLGDKKCAFCECKIPQIIQGAHILAVADIKKENHLTQDEKLALALDGDNGLWLCQNHHKLLDVNILRVSESGSIQYLTEINETASDFIKNTTVNNQLSNEIVTDKFVSFLNKRNKNIQENFYSELRY